jgi:hypothetical protein
VWIQFDTNSAYDKIVDRLAVAALSVRLRISHCCHSSELWINYLVPAIAILDKGEVMTAIGT